MLHLLRVSAVVVLLFATIFAAPSGRSQDMQALTTASRALRAQFGRHVAIARWTLPIWLYVSLTGVVIYLMLYQLY